MDPMKTHGAFSWSELMTTDDQAAGAFYKELFGWDIQPMPMPGMTYNVVNVQGKPVAGIMNIPESVPEGVPPHWGVYVTVDNVEETVKQCEDLGGSVLMAPMDIPMVGRFAVIKDPQGAVLNIITYAEQS